MLFTVGCLIPRFHNLVSMKTEPFKNESQSPFGHFSTNRAIHDVNRHFLISVFRMEMRRVVIKKPQINTDSMVGIIFPFFVNIREVSAFISGTNTRKV